MSKADLIVVVITTVIFTTCIYVGLVKLLLDDSKEEAKEKEHSLHVMIQNFLKLVSDHTEEINFLRAHVYDLEAKVKELENHNDS